MVCLGTGASFLFILIQTTMASLTPGNIPTYEYFNIEIEKFNEVIFVVLLIFFIKLLAFD